MKRRDFIKRSVLFTAGLSAFSCRQANGKKVKIVILGFDGANWPTIDPLIAAGKLPFLKQLKEECAWADFETFKPAKSNIIWTSIASGKTMLKHGIVDFAYLKQNGIEVPFDKSNRREPMIWQILDENDKRSIVLNWWCSHPPDKIDGIMASDNLRRLVTSLPGQIPAFKDSVYPARYFEKFKEIGRANNNYQEVIQRTGLPDYDSQFHQKYPNVDITTLPVIKSYRQFARHDAYIDAISRYLVKREDWDFFATYLRFPDVIQHFITLFLDIDFKEKLKQQLITDTLTREMNDEAILKISGLLEPAYQYMEKIIKDYLEMEKNQPTYFFIMSDHGFTLFPGGYNHYGLPDHVPAPAGILMIKGPGIKPGRIPKATVFDVAPSILYTFDLPLDKNMDGQPLEEIFPFQHKKRYRIYKLKKDQDAGRDSQYDKETLQDLKSMGYVK